MKVNIIQNMHCNIAISGNKYVFYSLSFNDEVLFKSIVDLIHFSELSTCFVSNFLMTKSSYKVGQCEMKMVRKDNVYYLCLNVYDVQYYFTKSDCKMITSVLNRIIARLDIFKSDLTSSYMSTSNEVA